MIIGTTVRYKLQKKHLIRKIIEHYSIACHEARSGKWQATLLFAKKQYLDEVGESALWRKPHEKQSNQNNAKVNKHI